MGEEHRHQHEHVGGHRLRRAVGGMTVDLLENQRDRDDLMRELSAGDMAQQVQLHVSGRAGKKLTHTELDVTWPYPFLMRVAQDQIETYLQNPHFSLGVELLSDGRTLIDAQIRKWNSNESEMVTGATIRVMAWSPFAQKKHKFAAILHLTFFGYAAPAEEDETDNE